MFELAMTALRAHLAPAVGFDQLDDVTNLGHDLYYRDGGAGPPTPPASGLYAAATRRSPFFMQPTAAGSPRRVSVSMGFSF
jgi:hypothetical protein